MALFETVFIDGAKTDNVIANILCIKCSSLNIFSEYFTLRVLMLPPLSVCDIHKYSSDVMAIIRYSECDIASIVIKQF